MASPLVIPPEVVGELDDWPASDLRVALAALRARHDAVLVLAPPSARRVRGDDDLVALEAFGGR
jgi:hypothetical protein